MRSKSISLYGTLLLSVTLFACSSQPTKATEQPDTITHAIPSPPPPLPDEESQRTVTKEKPVAMLSDAERALIVGTWEFEKFDLPNYMSPDSKEIIEATKENKGLITIFTRDNHFITKRKGKEIRGTYQVLKDKHLVFNKDTTELDRLDTAYLSFYEEGRGSVILKRKR